MVAQVEHRITIPMEGVHLEGDLDVPEAARGLVVLAHAGGIDRQRPDYAGLAGVLGSTGMATLVVDLSGEEAPAADNGAAVDRLARRLLGVTRWLTRRESTRDLPIGYVASGVAGAAALRAAASRGDDVTAVVVLDGRLDLASDALGEVAAATLVLVSDGESAGLERAREAVASTSGPSEVAALDTGGGPPDGPAPTDAVADRTAAWFDQHLR